ncbi:MAG: enoyl-CoA hydratase/isomerase family protein [Deltaproteobacteria bacterium]|nr:enoyl-CoA hydratase/isomerase family protein [Deltaproteobacteria bacterium]
MSLPEGPLLLDTLHDGVLTLTLNRPDKLNALDQPLVDALHSALAYYEPLVDIVRAVVICGAGGRAFAAGADIATLRNRNAGEALLAINATLFDRLARFPAPTIAAVTGYALGGGCELALACDLRIAGESAQFGQPETGLGILPAAGATSRLPQLVGMGRARELIFTGRLVGADEAAAMGLVNAVVPDDEVVAAAVEMAAQIAKNDGLATRLTKQALQLGEGNLEHQRRFANLAQGLCFDSPAKIARMDAFLARKAARRISAAHTAPSTGHTVPSAEHGEA